MRLLLLHAAPSFPRKTWGRSVCGCASRNLTVMAASYEWEPAYRQKCIFMTFVLSYSMRPCDSLLALKRDWIANHHAPALPPPCFHALPHQAMAGDKYFKLSQFLRISIFIIEKNIQIGDGNYIIFCLLLSL